MDETKKTKFLTDMFALMRSSGVSPVEAFLLLSGHMVESGCQLYQLFALQSLQADDPQDALADAFVDAHEAVTELLEPDGSPPNMTEEIQDVLDEAFVPYSAREVWVLSPAKQAAKAN